jgi:hypothetical protein
MCVSVAGLNLFLHVLSASFCGALVSTGRVGLMDGVRKNNFIGCDSHYLDPGLFL